MYIYMYVYISIYIFIYMYTSLYRYVESMYLYIYIYRLRFNSCPIRTLNRMSGEPSQKRRRYTKKRDMHVKGSSCSGPLGCLFAL